MKIINDILYSEDGDRRKSLDVYLPNECEATFIYFHGGGLKGGDKADIFFVKSLMEADIAVVSVNYSLYPNAIYPQFIRDAAAAVAYIYKNADEINISNRIFVGGSSAGAYLSMMLCFDKKYLSVYGVNSDSILGYIHDAGQVTAHYNVLRERGIDSRSVIVDETAPLFYVTQNNNYPPMLFIVSDGDMVNRYEQMMVMMKTLEHFENDMSKIRLVVMKNSNHCSYLCDDSSENSLLFRKTICEFIKNNK